MLSRTALQDAMLQPVDTAGAAPLHPLMPVTACPLDAVLVRLWFVGASVTIVNN